MDDRTSGPTWEEVATTHGRYLYTLAYRLTGHHADAQDLVQEVLLRVRRGLATYQDQNMAGWLSRITTNAFLDDVRRKKRRPADPLPDEPDRIIEGAPGADVAIDEHLLPGDVQSALDALPEDYRVCVVLCDVMGHTYQEIAESLDIPVGTVRSRIHRGRLQLRNRLAHRRPPR